MILATRLSSVTFAFEIGHNKSVKNNSESFIRSGVPCALSTVCVSAGTFLDRVNGQVVKRTGHYDTNQMETS